MKNLPATRKPEDLDSQLRIKFGATLTDVSLGIPPSLNDEEIIELGRHVRRMHNASAWWVADFVLCCQRMFLESRKSRRTVYDQIAKLWPQYARATLQDYASVARRVPSEIRSAHLSFEHHSHIATLADEPSARTLQSHFIKVAVDTEASAEQLRLIIADTRRGVQTERPIKRALPRASEAEQDGENSDAEPGEHKADDGLPIAKEPEPELLAGGHAQLASEAQRACSRLRDWYAAQWRKAKAETWPEDRRRVLVADLEPLIKEMHSLVDIYSGLTNTEQTGDWAGA